MSSRELVFIESIGRPPPPETMAARLLHAMSVDDEDIWDELGMREMRESDLEDAVALLQRLGWDIHYRVLQ